MDNEGRATGNLDLGLDRPRADSRPHRGRGGYYRQRRPGQAAERRGETYAALDLGTNNCRLLIARPSGDSFRVIDAFSRIIRLGEGVTATGRLSDAAIARAVTALSICRDKMHSRAVTRSRLIATEACRAAAASMRPADTVVPRHRRKEECSPSSTANPSFVQEAYIEAYQRRVALLAVDRGHLEPAGHDITHEDRL
jgi:hypothetical protein